MVVVVVDRFTIVRFVGNVGRAVPRYEGKLRRYTEDTMMTEEEHQRAGLEVA